MFLKAHSLWELNKIAALIDSTIVPNFTAEAMKDYMDLTFRCMEPLGERRPTMNVVVKELDQILEKERGQTEATIEGAAVVKLGSELFKV